MYQSVLKWLSFSINRLFSFLSDCSIMTGHELPLQIGVTGGIGSGKSVVCRLFECLGVPVYNADDRAKWLTTHDPEIIRRVTELLGTEAYLKNGDYNRAYVSSKVFTDAALLSGLNAIIHPAVLRDTENWVRRHVGLAYVVKEAAIMKKAGEGNNLDSVIVVEAPEALRIQRVLQRDNRSLAEVKAIIERQVSDEIRREVGDFVVVNDSFSALIPQVMILHEKLTQKSALRNQHPTQEPL
jgi:dephospho-CoA kinase